MKHRRRKGIKAAILALATASVLAPAASGYVYFGERAPASGYSLGQHVRPDDRGGVRGIEPVGAQSDYVDRQVANGEAASVNHPRPDDRGGVRGPDGVGSPAIVRAHGDGFDWTDAGIGASAALLAAALGGAAAAVSRRRTGLAV
jgi:hypothetical protein